jgi:hypothetical protein
MLLSFGSWKEQRQNHAFAHPVLPEKSVQSRAMRYAFRGWSPSGGDKKPEDSTTLQELIELYQSRGKKK